MYQRLAHVSCRFPHQPSAQHTEAPYTHPGRSYTLTHPAPYCIQFRFCDPPTRFSAHPKEVYESIVATLNQTVTPESIWFMEWVRCLLTRAPKEDGLS